MALEFDLALLASVASDVCFATFLFSLLQGASLVRLATWHGKFGCRSAPWMSSVQAQLRASTHLRSGNRPDLHVAIGRLLQTKLLQVDWRTILIVGVRRIPSGH